MGELILLYDEDCGFCTRGAARVARGPGIEAEAIGSAAGAGFLRDLTHEERYTAFHVVDALGRRSTGGAAIPPLLRQLPGGVLPAALCAALPGLTERAYGLVARHRGLLAKLLPI